MPRSKIHSMMAILCGVCASGMILADDEPMLVMKLGWDGRDAPRIVAHTEQHLIISTHAESERHSLMAWEISSRKLQALLPRNSAWSPQPQAVRIGGKVFVLAGSSLLQDLVALWALEGGSPVEMNEVCVMGPTRSTLVFLPSPDATHAIIGLLESDEREAGPLTLWRTDGTAGGTVCLGKGSNHYFGTYVRATPLDKERWAVLSPRRSSTGAYEPGMWISDGTPDHTSYVPLPQMPDYPPLGNGWSASIGGSILFVPFRYHASAVTLWRTDGTPGGTGELTTIRWQGRRAEEARMCAMNEHAYILLVDSMHGWDLWRTDGTKGGTVLVKSMEPYKDSPFSFPQHSSKPAIAAVGGRLVFVVDDGDHGEEPWVSDGTAEGTRLLKDCNPGPGDCKFAMISQQAGRVQFWSRTKDFVDRPWMELWSTDGTETRTTRLAQMHTNRWNKCAADRTSVIAGGHVFFECFDSKHGHSLWSLRLNGVP